MVILHEVTKEQLEQDNLLLYIYTPFCGTCNVAKSMLKKMESVHNKEIFYQMNASLHPEFMQDYKIESVPCLFIKRNKEVKEKIYAFKSIGNIYSYLIEYKPELFIQD